MQGVTRLWWIVLLVVALAASACGAETDGGPGGVSSPGGSSSSAAGTPPSTPQGELRINLAGEPNTIDPNKASFANSVSIVQNLFDPLLKFQPDLTVTPGVAKEVPNVQNGGISKDLLTYTFKLRDDVKWSDGKTVTAQDFEYSLKRTLDPKTAAEYASFYYDIKGAEAYNSALGTEKAPKQLDDAGLAKLRDGLGIKAPDATTVVIELAQPTPHFLQLMALWVTSPIRKDVVDAKGDKWTEAGSLVGNGAFLLGEWVHQDHITLTPNPSYYGEKAKIAKLTLYMVADNNANYAAYRSGERDMTDVPVQVVKQVLADPELKSQVLRFNDLVTFAYQFNITRPPFDNAKVRMAFNRAINREGFAEKVSAGVGKPAYSWIPPGMPGHDANLGKDIYGYDPAKAKQLLTEAGFPDPSKLPAVAFQYASTASNQLRAEFFQGQIKDNLGVDVKLEPMEPAAFSNAINQDQFHVAFLGWGADYPDPQNWLPEIFGTGGGLNHTQYSSPRFDSAVRKAAAEPDESKRLAAWAEAQKIMTEDAPIVPLIYRERFWLVKPHLKGLTTTAKDAQIPGDKYFNKAWLEKP